jgi:hypothetical protein
MTRSSIIETTKPPGAGNTGRPLIQPLVSNTVGVQLMDIVPQEGNDKSGYVYIIWAVGTPRYKIGRTNNPQRRLWELGLQSCYPLELIATRRTKDCEAYEKRLHLLLHKWRVFGEWFELPKDLLLFTDQWFKDPTCSQIKSFSSSKILFVGKARGPKSGDVAKSKTISELHLKALSKVRHDHPSVSIPEGFKLPDSREDVEKLIQDLGNLSIVERKRWKDSVLSDVFRLTGVSIEFNDQARNLKTLLKICKNTCFADSTITKTVESCSASVNEIKQIAALAMHGGVS